MSTGEDHEGLADELDEETKRLERESGRVESEISEVRSDWEAKRRDPSVPGAPEPEGDEETEPPPEENPKDRDISPG